MSTTEVPLEKMGAGDGRSLFDASVFEDPQLALPKMDGFNSSRIAVKFTGTVFLDRTDPDDVAWFRELELNGVFNGHVEGLCVKKSWAFGDEQVRSEVAVTLHTAYKP